MIQRYFIIRGPFYSNTHKYVCVSVMISCMWYAYTPFVFAHCSPWVICSISVFRSTPAYHCITILNTLRLSRVSVMYPFLLHSIFRRISSSFSHKHRMMLSSSFRIAPTPSSEPDVLPVSFIIACFARLLFGFAPR
jgi:hypothetical protein